MSRSVGGGPRVIIGGVDVSAYVRDISIDAAVDAVAMATVVFYMGPDDSYGGGELCLCTAAPGRGGAKSQRTRGITLRDGEERT